MDRGLILDAVYEVVSAAMPYDDEAVEKIVSETGNDNDGKIALDYFIQEGKGVCRHQALACAALLERFKDEGYIRGTASVDRNSDTRGGHSWCRYTNSEGTVIGSILHYELATVEQIKNKLKSHGIPVRV